MVKKAFFELNGALLEKTSVQYCTWNAALLESIVFAKISSIIGFDIQSVVIALLPLLLDLILLENFNHKKITHDLYNQTL